MALHRQPPRPGAVQRAGIVVDDWKLPIFEKRLREKGYTFENKGAFTPGTTVLQVLTTDAQALHKVVAAANLEAAKSKKR